MFLKFENKTDQSPGFKPFFRLLLSLYAALLLATTACKDREAPAPEPSAASVEPAKPDLWQGFPALENPPFGPFLEAKFETLRQDVEVAAGLTPANPKALGQAYGELGMRYHAFLLRDQAIWCYRKAMALQTGRMDWPYYLGQLYYFLGDFEQSKTMMAKAAALASQPYAPLEITLGQLEIQANNVAAARRHFERALQVDSRAARAWFGLVEVAMQENDFEAAEVAAQKVLEMDPEATAVFAMLGTIYRATGRHDEAQKIAAKITSEGRQPRVNDPKILAVQQFYTAGYALLDAGDRAAQDGQLEQALEYYQQAADFYPRNSEVLNKLGALLGRMGKLEASVEVFEKAVEQLPSEPKVHINLANALLDLGRHEKAHEALQKALEVDPENPRVKLLLAELYCNTGRYDDGLDMFDAGIRAQPDDAFAHHRRILCHMRAGNWESAIAFSEKAGKAFSDRPDFALMQARLLSAVPQDELRNGQKALALLQKIKPQKPSLSYLEVLAMAQAESGDMERALQTQSTALKLAQENGLQQWIPRLEAQLAHFQSGRPARL